MRRIDFQVPIYNWSITVVTLYGPSDAEEFSAVLKEIDADVNATAETIESLKKGGKNGGDFWYNKGVRVGLIDVFPWTNEGKLYEILNHEKRHLVDRILEHAGIHDIEAAAYLDGYVSTQIFEHLKELTT